MSTGENYLCYSCGGIGEAIIWRHQYNCQWCHTRGNGTLTDEPIRRPANWSEEPERKEICVSPFAKMFRRYKSLE